MVDTDLPQHNHLLAALPPPTTKACRLILNGSKCRAARSYTSQAVICITSISRNHIISLFYVMEDGASVEVAGIGNEGMLGVALILGGKPCLIEPSC